MLSELEADTFEQTLVEILEKLWQALDSGLTATAFDGAECVIWRSIDGDDTAFLARRIIAIGKKNAVVGEQIRMLIDRWGDFRVLTIIGPRLVQTEQWYPAHGMDLSAWGLPVVPPRARRGGRGRGAPPASGPESYATNGATPGAAYG